MSSWFRLSFAGCVFAPKGRPRLAGGAFGSRLRRMRIRLGGGASRTEIGVEGGRGGKEEEEFDVVKEGKGAGS